MDDNVRALQAYKSSDRLDASLRLRLSEPNPDPAACIMAQLKYKAEEETKA